MAKRLERTRGRPEARRLERTRGRTEEPRGGEGFRGRGPVRRVLEEHVELDVSGLNQEQIELLRERLREFVAGVGDLEAEIGPIDLIASHSSHTDDDGWI